MIIKEIKYEFSWMLHNKLRGREMLFCTFLISARNFWFLEIYQIKLISYQNYENIKLILKQFLISHQSSFTLFQCLSYKSYIRENRLILTCANNDFFGTILYNLHNPYRILLLWKIIMSLNVLFRKCL